MLSCCATKNWNCLGFSWKKRTRDLPSPLAVYSLILRFFAYNSFAPRTMNLLLPWKHSLTQERVRWENPRFPCSRMSGRGPPCWWRRGPPCWWRRARRGRAREDGRKASWWSRGREPVDRSAGRPGRRRWRLRTGKPGGPSSCAGTRELYRERSQLAFMWRTLTRLFQIFDGHFACGNRRTDSQLFLSIPVLQTFAQIKMQLAIKFTFYKIYIDRKFRCVCV